MSLRSKKAAKALLFEAVHRSGAFHLLRGRHNAIGRRITIVTFHRVGDSDGDPRCSLPTLFISRDKFSKTIDFFRTHYRIISLPDLLAALYGSKPVASNSLLLTFDDGYKDVFENALPEMAARQVPATVFLPTDFVGATDKGFWWDECYFLLRELARRPEALDDILKRLGHADLVRRFAAASRDIVFLVGEMQSVPERDRRSVLDALWDETDAQRATVLEHNATADWPTIRRAAKDGMTFGSHTCSHMFLHCADPHSARDELRRSKLEIERQLDRPVQAFAYPGGRLTPETARWVEEAGYGCAVTTDAGVNQAADSPFTLKRISIWNGTVTGPSGRFSPAKLAVNLLALRRPA